MIKLSSSKAEGRTIRRH